jgi:hypothetical protein
MASAVEPGPGHGFGIGVGAIGARIVLGNRPLVFRKHINAEPFSGMQMSVRAGLAIDADQHQRGIERNGSKGVRRHAMNCAVNGAMSFSAGFPLNHTTPFFTEIERDNGHARGEAAHRLAKFGRIQAHR